MSLVSVIVPCFNAEKTLQRTLESLIAQTHENWECIIVDDGSTDSTAAIARELTKTDARFRYLRQENAGVSAARNLGLQHASGEWVHFLDSDDTILPGMYDSCLALAGDELDVVLVPFRFLDGQTAEELDYWCSIPWNDLSFERFLFGWGLEFTIPPISFLIRRKLLADTRFDEDLTGFEEWNVWLKVWSHDPAYAVCSESLCCYHYYRASASRKVSVMKEMQLKAASKIYSGLTNESLKAEFVSRQLYPVTASYLSFRHHDEHLQGESCPFIADLRDLVNWTDIVTAAEKHNNKVESEQFIRQYDNTGFLAEHISLRKLLGAMYRKMIKH